MDLVSYFAQTHFKDQPNIFKNASFGLFNRFQRGRSRLIQQRIFLARTIFQQPITLGGLVSGIKFPNDIVLKDAEFLQTLLNNVAVNDINVSGGITMEGKVNNIDYNVACDLLSSDSSPYGLILERK